MLINCDGWLLIVGFSTTNYSIALYSILFSKILLVSAWYDISDLGMCIYSDYCVYHYKSTVVVSLYTLYIGL